MYKLDKGEKILLKTNPKEIRANALLAFDIRLNSQVVVTNKKIIIFLNEESRGEYLMWKDAQNFYYKKPANKRCDKWFFCTNYTIKKYWVEGDNFYIKYGPGNKKSSQIKINSPNAKKISNLIDKYKK